MLGLNNRLKLGSVSGDSSPGGPASVWLWEAGIAMQWEAGIFITID
jgi:hypothetical protein